MRISFLIGLLAVFMLQFASSTSPLHAAQSKEPTSAFKDKLKKLDDQVKKSTGNVDNCIKKIEDNKRIKKGDCADIDSSLLKNYATGLKGAFDEATGDAKKAADSNGSEGNTGNFNALNDLAHKKHDPFLKDRNDKIEKIKTEVADGTIVIDKSLLDEATPEQLEEFRQSLSPSAHDKYPELFKRSFLDLHQFAALKGNDWQPSLADLSHWIISPAEAAQTALCLVTCFTANDWVKCLQCLAGATASVTTAWAGFLDCWAATKKPFWMPIGLWHTGCVATLTIIIG